MLLNGTLLDGTLLNGTLNVASFSWPTGWSLGSMVALVKLPQTLWPLPRGDDKKNKTV